MSSEKTYNPDLRESVGELRGMREKAKALSNERWPMHDVDLKSFSWEFRSVIPDEEKGIIGEDEAVELFTAYIKSILNPDRNDHLIALELGGPGVKLFNGFPKRFFKKTLGVCLEDTQNPVQQENQRPNHEIIRGDLFRNDTYKKIETAIDANGADLIISRLYGGLDEITHDPVVLAKVMRTWYKLLREGGLMFIQYRLSTGDKWISKTEIQKDVREKLMEEWVKFIQDNYGDTLEIQLDRSVFRLRKKEGAPKELPVLQSFDRSPIIEKRPASIETKRARVLIDLKSQFC